MNAIISQLLSLLQIEHELSLAYSKEHNAIMERANKEVMRHLTAIIFDKRVNAAWSSEYLPLVQRIMNAKVHDTIGVSPAELLYGKAINLYTGLLSPFPPESLVKGQEETVSGRYPIISLSSSQCRHCLLRSPKTNSWEPTRSI